MSGNEEWDREQVTTKVGDNKEFVVVGISTVTVHFNDSSLTSANDTSTDLYFDHNANRHKICLRTDKTLRISKINDVTLTSPITVVAATSYTERFFGGGYNSLELLIESANTAVKVRVL